MSYEGEAFGIIPIPDVEVPGDVADWLLRQARIYGQSPGEWIGRLVTTAARLEMAGGQAKPSAEPEVMCMGCHARGQFTGEQLLRLRDEGVTWLKCEVCGEQFTSAEWAVFNSIFREPAA